MEFIRIGIYMAMESEAKAFIESLEFTSGIDTSPYGFKSYSAEDKNYKIQLLVGEQDSKYNVQSVGTVPAAIATDMLIKNFNPNVVINAGTAGGFKSRGAQIGEVYAADSTQFHNRRIQIPGYAEYGRYYLTHKNDYYQKIISNLNLKAGLLTTGDSLDYSDLDKELVEPNKAVIKDMEAAAIAWVCYHHQTPAIFLKSVTDIVDGPHANVNEFLQNLQEASTNLSKTLIRLIQSHAL
ncbi:MAG: hypothetical protein MK008_11865 [Bdellovibrionales bacterium]|nr:hypothetical protein [Bdellovibrionales bacterium]